MPDFLPVSREDMERRGIEQLDFVLVTGDAYVDHPSFGTAIIGRVLEDAGFSVGIISQPDWWNDDFAAAFLGDYSDEKYEEFIKATGVSDLSDMDNSEISALCRQFVYYLREKRDNGSEVLEKDGRPMLDGIIINA